MAKRRQKHEKDTELALVPRKTETGAKDVDKSEDKKKSKDCEKIWQREETKTQGRDQTSFGA